MKGEIALLLGYLNNQREIIKKIIEELKGKDVSTLNIKWTKQSLGRLR